MRYSSTQNTTCKLSVARFSLSILVYGILSGVAYGVPDEPSVRAALVEVRGVNRIDREYPIATGFVVNNEGYVVTVGQEAIKNAQRIVVAPFMGAGASFEVTQVQHHPVTEVTLLHVPALRAQPLGFEDSPESGQPVYVPLKEGQDFWWGLGSIESFVRRPVQAYGGTEQRFIGHSTDLYAPIVYGAPLLSDRGTVLGINHRHPDLPRDALTRNTRPEGTSFAIPSSDLAAFLQSNGISFQQALASGRVPEPSYQAEGPSASGAAPNESTQPGAPPAATDPLQVQLNEVQFRWERERQVRLEAQRQAIEARERAEELERLAEDAVSRSTMSEQDREEARRAALAARAASEEAEALANDAMERAQVAEEAVLELEARFAEEQALRQQVAEGAALARRNLFIAGIAGGVSILLLAVWFMGYVRRSSSKLKQAKARVGMARYDAQHAQSAAARAVRAAPFDCLMQGESPEGRRLTLNIPAKLLGASEGVVIGRNPKYADIVVDHKGVSRRHARLFVADGSLCIEDLNSTNGSFVNDLNLIPNHSAPLRHGQTVRLGPVQFTLSLTSQ